ncbi:MAG: hypothetical protein AUJ08_05525 [Thaumarchaeota archaeon 13_1_40CM_3_50_5]|nr:MAG: hypothetical protein AUH37_03875 [Candidatus Nitrososphaera sp. 13_1_40CM_48_12]OLC24590.1 MAG: hypothetical protein AUH71_02425 [Thaumarchaeota archaeon 13_1_40CM_4_48_7]OLC83317.1 MAG: hypothetical protein AUJ08_05525 [Thaumarchaeota archaeon 13_1_40CM_3_50_5]
MRRQTAAKIMALVAISGFSSYWLGIPNVALALNPNRSAVDAALGQLSRAESAQTPNEAINYLIRAKSQLPESGPVRSWSPEKANFESIQAELDDLINRARNISLLNLGDELHDSEMYAIHKQIEAIQETLVAL